MDLGDLFAKIGEQKREIARLKEERDDIRLRFEDFVEGAEKDLKRLEDENKLLKIGIDVNAKTHDMMQDIKNELAEENAEFKEANRRIKIAHKAAEEENAALKAEVEEHKTARTRAANIARKMFRRALELRTQSDKL